MAFLPTTREEMLEQGYEQVDFVYVNGDAYVDHPSFGCAIITRVLQAYGYSCAILAQPDWHKDEEFLQFGEPRLGFLVSAGNIDSMVNHYSVNKRRRDHDSYSDDGVMGKRPDRPTIVYTQILKRLFPHKPVLIGGIEASLRRLSHYDYWDDAVRRSILMDSQADLLMYGMGENTIVEVADALASGLAAKDLCYIRGTCWKTKSLEYLSDYILLPSYEEVKADKRTYAKSFHIQHENIDAIAASVLVEPYDGWYVVQNQPPLPLTQEEMDFTYSLPYERTFHPKYHYIPAIEEVQFSIVSNRGCFGSCAFCAITHHQGRVISTRSKESIVEEAKRITEMPNFKGYIHDVGGPTANFSREACDKQREFGACKKRECLFPKPCGNMVVDHSRYLDILRSVRELPKIKKVFIRSGIRYDYLMQDKNDEFFDELVKYHISGQLKVAPEHINAAVLDKMGKPRKELYLKFVEKLGMPLQDKKVLYPNDLKQQHDLLMKKIKIVKSKILNDGISKNAEKLEKYQYKNDHFVIMPAKSYDDLAKESAELNHCVRTYADRIAKGETGIMLIRMTNQIDKPFVTLELKGKRIVQVRGKNNHTPPDDVNKFIKKWESQFRLSGW